MSMRHLLTPGVAALTLAAAWILRDVRTEGQAALDLFLGTLKVVPDEPAR